MVPKELKDWHSPFNKHAGHFRYLRRHALGFDGNISKCMSEDLEKKEILEPALIPDNLTRTESIKTSEQNQDHTHALASNPDQFPSIANLQIPNKDQIEPFQIIDDGKTIAASRNIKSVDQGELVEPAGNSSFHEGLSFA